MSLYCLSYVLNVCVGGEAASSTRVIGVAFRWYLELLGSEGLELKIIINSLISIEVYTFKSRAQKGTLVYCAKTITIKSSTERIQPTNLALDI